MFDLSLQPPVIGLPWLFFIFLSSDCPRWSGGSSHDLHYRSPYKSKNNVSIVLIWLRLQLHIRVYLTCLNGMASTCPSLQFSCISTFRFGLQAPIVLEEDETWTSISILLRTLTGSDGFQATLSQGRIVSLVVWLEVGTVRSGMCFGFALAEETKWQPIQPLPGNTHLGKVTRSPSTTLTGSMHNSEPAVSRNSSTETVMGEGRSQKHHY